MPGLVSKESNVLKFNFCVITNVNSGISLHRLGPMPTRPKSIANLF